MSNRLSNLTRPVQICGIKESEGRCLTFQSYGNDRMAVSVGIQGALYDKADLVRFLRSIIDAIDPYDSLGGT